jgi:hypothetical protein
MRTLTKAVIAGAIVFAVLQLVRPVIPAKLATAEIQAPPAVKNILEKDCYSCHSDQRRLSWFDEIVPAYWLVRHDVLTARRHLDFSTLGSKPAAAQRAALYEAVTMIQLGAMPLPNFVQLHPEAKVTPEDLATLKTYLNPWPTDANEPAGAPATGNKTETAPPAPPTRVDLTAVQPEFNGVPFEPSFESWKIISTTERGDNNTFRFILGNDIAIKAAQSGNISPWPDGSRFAKIAWQRETGADGLLHPGKFIQVELMVKDAQRYRDTDGWGWGRWRGADLKPYGANAGFVNECTGCHQPVRGNDYVYTLPISGAVFSGNEVVNNRAAALPASLPYQPLNWNPITMYVDAKTRTTATLYGNDAAMQAIKASGQKGPAYPFGAILALVTWTQRDDAHWFGARIPDAPLSVEFVQSPAQGKTAGYQRFSGAVLAEDRPMASVAAQRSSFILGLAPAWLP